MRATPNARMRLLQDLRSLCMSRGLPPRYLVQARRAPARNFRDALRQALGEGWAPQHARGPRLCGMPAVWSGYPHKLDMRRSRSGCPLYGLRHSERLHPLQTMPDTTRTLGMSRMHTLANFIAWQDETRINSASPAAMSRKSGERTQSHTSQAAANTILLATWEKPPPPPCGRRNKLYWTRSSRQPPAQDYRLSSPTRPKGAVRVFCCAAACMLPEGRQWPRQRYTCRMRVGGNVHGSRDLAKSSGRSSSVSRGTWRGGQASHSEPPHGKLPLRRPLPLAQCAPRVGAGFAPPPPPRWRHAATETRIPTKPR